MKKNNQGLLWITGFSGAGKTTVASLVSDKLRAAGLPVVLFDGDEIRSILGEKFGHALEDRRHLAGIYGRLCKKVADNGITVVIATVAMFESVRRENRIANSNYLEIYLDVPFDIRSDRDPKGIYKAARQTNLDKAFLSAGMEEPTNPDLIIQNYDQVTPDLAASMIVNEYMKLITTSATTGDLTENSVTHRADYWDAYYAKRKAPINPSSFALFCNENYLANPSILIEFGCGNGRDSFYFSKNHNVVAVDESSVVIEANSMRAKEEGFLNVRFLQGQFGLPIDELPSEVDAVYARFVIHAMPEECETRALNEAWKLLKNGGLLLLEFRTNRDPLMEKGVRISSTERITDHYRRFIDFSAFCEKVSSIGFEINYMVEKKGLAAYGNDDPVVARVIASKHSG